MVSGFFQDLVSVDVEISQVNWFDTFMNCYQGQVNQQFISINDNFQYSYPHFNMFIYVFFQNCTTEHQNKNCQQLIT